MHRLITKAVKGQKIDHVDGDGLNNRKNNLRFCTHAENMHNSRRRSGKQYSSKYRGVYLDKQGRVDGSSWRAKIRLNTKIIRLGTYSTELEAALAYDRAAKEFHGEFASLNFKDSLKLEEGKK